MLIAHTNSPGCPGQKCDGGLNQASQQAGEGQCRHHGSQKECIDIINCISNIHLFNENVWV